MPHWDKTFIQYDTLKPLDYSINVEINDISPLQKVVFPSLFVAANSHIDYAYHNKKKVSFISAIPFFSYGNLEVNDLSFDLEDSIDYPVLDVNVDHIKWSDSLYFDNVHTSVKEIDSIIDLNIEFKNDSLASGDFRIKFDCRSKNVWNLWFDKFFIEKDGEVWELKNPSNILVKEKKIYVDQMVLENNLLKDHHQSFWFNGIISSDTSDAFYGHFKNLDITPINDLIDQPAFMFSGITNLDFKWKAVLTNPNFEFDLNIKDFKLNDYLIGDFQIESFDDMNNDKISVRGGLVNDNKKVIDINGIMSPFAKDSVYLIDITLNDFSSSILNEVFPKTVLTDLKGGIDSKLSLHGNWFHPIFDGDFSLKNISFFIPFANTSYTIEGKGYSAEGILACDYIDVFDEEQNKAKANVSLFHTNFLDYSFEIFGFEAKRMLALNTTLKHNQDFFGRVYGAGEINISGYKDNVTIEVNASTGEKSKLTIPLYTEEDEKLDDFIVFEKEVVLDTLQTTTKKEQDYLLSGVDIKLNMDVTPNSLVEIDFDETADNKILGSGEGKLSLHVSPSGKIEMYGDIIIEQANYNFTVENLINKKFTIDKGGTLKWYGDPYNAEIDLKARYKLYTSLYDIMGAFAEDYKNKSEVHDVMKLSGVMLNPTTDFDIEIPDADDQVNLVLESIKSNERNLKNQFFALLIFNKFFATTGNQSQSNAAAATSTVTDEFISSQVSSWLSHVSDDFDLGFNYRSASDVSSQEIALAFSTALFKEKLKFIGNFGVASGGQSASTTATKNEFIGDFFVKYDIDDEINLHAFNQTNPTSVSSIYESRTKQGIGLGYSESFDSWTDYTSDYEGTAQEIAKRFTERGWVGLGENKAITPEHVIEIVTNSY